MKKQVPKIMDAKYVLTEKNNMIFNKGFQNKNNPNEVYIVNSYKNSKSIV